MKRYIVTFMVMTYMLFAGEITWLHTYKEGVKASREQHKPMLIFIYKQGCGACEFMEEDVFTDKMIYSYVNKAFIPVKLNINNDAPKNLQTVATPTFHFVNERGEKVEETLVGEKTGTAFLNLFKDAVKNYKKSLQ